MILPRYATVVAKVDDYVIESVLVRRALGLDRSRPMIYALEARGMAQADLVLALLRVGTRRARALVELLLGRPVLVIPSAWLRWPINGVPRVYVPRIARVVANPRRPSTPAYDRFLAAFRPGRTIEEARMRGATKRDVRMARRLGWIEEVAS